MASEPQLPSADDILRVLMEAEANGGKFFRAVDQETLVGGKRVTKQKVPKLPESAATTIHQVKVTLYGSKPPIWRRLELPSPMTLGRLHHVLQAAFTWDGYHLHVFETVCGEFGDPLQDDGWAERQDEETVTIAQVAAAEKAKIVYVYDFGDDWRHDIAVEKILPAAPGIAYPRCTAGRREAPPEDCGGIWAYDPDPPEFGQFDPDALTDELSSLAEVIVTAYSNNAEARPASA